MGALDSCVAKIKEEFPDFKLVPKEESTLMKVCDFLLKLITFWQMRVFMTQFTTTIGYTVYTPTTWDAFPELSQVGVLTHERVHMRQRKKYGWFLFSFLYLFFPLPTLFAYYRRKFEQEAYAESMRYLAERRGVGILEDPSCRESFVEKFTTAQYFWTWVIRSHVERWYDRVLAQLKTELP
jgi:hypothetical protein